MSEAAIPDGGQSTRPVPPPAHPLLRSDATDLARALRDRQVTAVELLDLVLARADEITPTVNPFAIRLDERARAAAEESDRRIAGGSARPLEGLPIAAKDSQWMAGIPTYSGTLGDPHVPDRTVGAVQRIEAAGAVIFAKTTTSEFCYSGISYAPGFGHTGNPHDTTRTAGGSSGGTAAQVAAYAGPVGLGGDGGGSIRIPAAFCGIVGFKPTFGAISHEPSGPSWKTLIGVGPMSRSVRDAQMLVRAMAGADPRDRHGVDPEPDPGHGRLRVAYSEDLGFADVDDVVRDRYRSALDAFDRAGAQLVPVPADAGFTSSVRTWATIASAEARWSQRDLIAEQGRELSDQVRNYLAFGEGFSAEDYVRAQFDRETIHSRYVGLFEGETAADVLFTPTLGCTAFDRDLAFPTAVGGHDVVDPWRDWAPLLYDANLAGLPALSLPIGTDSQGLPIGGQLVGPRRSDYRVLRAAALLESAVNA